MLKQKRCLDNFFAKGVLQAVEEGIRKSYAIRGIVSDISSTLSFSETKKVPENGLPCPGRSGHPLTGQFSEVVGDP